MAYKKVKNNSAKRKLFTLVPPDRFGNEAKSSLLHYSITEYIIIIKTKSKTYCLYRLAFCQLMTDQSILVNTKNLRMTIHFLLNAIYFSDSVGTRMFCIEPIKWYKSAENLANVDLPYAHSFLPFFMIDFDVVVCEFFWLASQPCMDLLFIQSYMSYSIFSLLRRHLY